MGAITVAELWRYPVKSMQGEQVTAADVTAAGLDGDRQWGLLDRATGLTLTARRVPELLFGRAALTADGDVRVELPDGTVAADDAALSDWLGRDVTLRRAGADVAGTFEIALDAEDEAGVGVDHVDRTDRHVPRLGPHPGLPRWGGDARAVGPPPVPRQRRPRRDRPGRGGRLRRVHGHRRHGHAPRSSSRSTAA